MGSLTSQLTNAPNLVTMGRVALIPAVLLFLDNFSPLRSFIAAILYLLAAAGDGLDGYLARSRGQVSVLGQFLDPLADKLMVTATLVYLVAMGRVPAWVVVLLIARDVAITGLRSIASAEGLVIAASEGGKVKTALQFAGTVMLMIHFRYPMWGLNIPPIDFHAAGVVILYMSLAMSLLSAAEYIRFFFRAVAVHDRGIAPPAP